MRLHPNAALPARRSNNRAREAGLLPRFFNRPAARVARALLGCELECRIDGVRARGRIVEVEAYLGSHDAASHSAVGLTRRNRHMHGAPGTAYVYRIYGIHWCVNAVTRETGLGSAVLIRALAPLEGLDAMDRRRGGVPMRELTNGPGKLCQALGITGALDGARLDGARLDGSSLRLLRGTSIPDAAIVVTPRIGITQAADWPLRYLVKDEPNVSRTPRAFARLSLEQANAWLSERRLR